MNITAFNIVFFRSSDQSGVLQYEQEQEPEPYEGSEEAERGYLSDVCDYNIVPQQEEKKAKKITSKEEDVGVIHGKLELNISREKQFNPASRVLQVFITLLFCLLFFFLVLSISTFSPSSTHIPSSSCPPPTPG